MNFRNVELMKTMRVYVKDFALSLHNYFSQSRQCRLFINCWAASTDLILSNTLDVRIVTLYTVHVW